MNFYSDKIINNIIDNEPVEDILDSIHLFEETSLYLLLKYSYNKIYYKYTQTLLKDPQNIIAFHCIDQEFNIYNCPSILVYHKCYEPEINTISYYILFTCTKQSYRNQGYASKLLDGLIQRIQDETRKYKDKHYVRIVLSSVEDAVIFYENYGFRWTRDSISKYEILTKYESYEENKDYFILEKKIYLGPHQKTE